MHDSEVKVGTKFVDEILTSQPEEYRIHVITRVMKDTFKARHIATTNERTFARAEEVLDNLSIVPNMPTLFADLDPLVGEKVRVELVDGGSLKAIITAVRYGEIVIGDKTMRYVAGVELDRSGSTTYTLAEIAKITRVD